MDNLYPYVASLTREAFLFYEMRSTARLMEEKKSDEMVIKEIVEQPHSRQMSQSRFVCMH